MAANSIPRRIVKKLLSPVVGTATYTYLQALPMAWDIRTGTWSEPELDLIPLTLRSGDVALDIGANFGLYSYHMSRAVGPTGRVFAFEPVPFTNKTLSIVSKLLRFRGVEIVRKGCSDRAGKIVFQIPLQANGGISAGMAFIGTRTQEHAGKETQVRWSATREVTAEVLRLDDFLPPVSNVSLVKCDTEGAELLVFRGGERTIAKHLPTVICEINPWYMEGFGLRVSELTDFFFSKGYELYRYTAEGRGHGVLTRVAPEAIIEDNYVFVHPSRKDRVASLLPQA